MVFHRLLAVATLFVVPVPGSVIRHFHPPACERCAGHRGVTLRTSAGDPVMATTNGVVEFAGPVGDRLYVVQRISPSVRVTYGALASVSVEPANPVAAGQVIGVASETTYLSVRVGETHVEPLRALGLGRSRLVPHPTCGEIVGVSGCPR